MFYFAIAYNFQSQGSTLNAGQNLSITTTDKNKDSSPDSTHTETTLDAKQQDMSAVGSFTYGSMSGSANISAS
ncbi:hypothetical protein GKR48_13210 [Providencia sp. wls1943]|nr:hypothetical protein [Providencia sp. wls1943]MTB67767.1 hypothetical protein [Providencia sp. wls1943]